MPHELFLLFVLVLLLALCIVTSGFVITDNYAAEESEQATSSPQ